MAEKQKNSDRVIGKLYEIPISVSVPKVLWKHGHTHLFRLWLLLPYKNIVLSHGRDSGLSSQKHILSGPFKEKLANSWTRTSPFSELHLFHL